MSERILLILSLPDSFVCSVIQQTTPPTKNPLLSCSAEKPYQTNKKNPLWFQFQSGNPNSLVLIQGSFCLVSEHHCFCVYVLGGGVFISLVSDSCKRAVVLSARHICTKLSAGQAVKKVVSWQQLAVQYPSTIPRYDKLFVWQLRIIVFDEPRTG